MPGKSPPSDLSGIAEALRRQRVQVLHKGLRQMAKLLDVAPAYVTDIEKGRRAPGEDLLVRMAHHYQIDEADLRTAYAKADPVVDEVATQDTTTIRKVPELLRTARNLTPEQWDRMIKQAQRLSTQKKKGQ